MTDWKTELISKYQASLESQSQLHQHAQKVMGDWKSDGWPNNSPYTNRQAHGMAFAECWKRNENEIRILLNAGAADSYKNPSDDPANRLNAASVIELLGEQYD